MRFLFLLLLTIPMMLVASDAPRKKVHVNNRVLAVVNGKVISVVDLMKKMDMLLYQYYPQYLDVPEARFQFYTAQWKELLSELIDKELVLADAEEKHFEVSSGDVREELEEIFGPEVMINLDTTGLSMEEAWTLIKAEITMRRMMSFQVSQRVAPQITPALIKRAYQERVHELADQTEMQWLSITFKSSDTKKAVEVADAAYKLITTEKIGHDRLEEELKGRSLLQEGVILTVSQLFSQKAESFRQASSRFLPACKRVATALLSSKIAVQDKRLLSASTTSKR